ncbi:retrovirus-related pol polyprotein from transposon TNT 1-94 [Tanacetum coccineum]
MKMKILLEPTSNKLMKEHAEFDESDTHVLERFNTSAGNPVKEILLKLNLPDHRILKDGEDIQCAGSDTRPPMLDKADFASWQQRIRLYYRGKDNGVNILKSIGEGPFQMGTTRVIVAEGAEGSLNLGPERPRDIWDNVKMLLEGSELTKEDRESQLYDDFEHFRQNKGETIHDYYFELKVLSNMMPEWGRFVTAVKLNKGLKDSNFDQLYAYLKQHEAHANENKMMLERLTQQTVDPLALMSNVSPQHYHSQSSTNPPTTYHQPHSADTSQSDLGLSPTDNLIENLTNTLALLTQSYKTFLPQTNNQLRTSSKPKESSYLQDFWGGQSGAVSYGRAQNRVGNANPGQARQVKCYNCNGVGHIARNCTQPKRPQNSEYFKDKMLLMQAQENGVVLDEEQLLFLAGGQDNAIDEDVDEQPVQDLALNVDNVFQADDCDAYDSDVDEAPTAQTMFMANLSSAISSNWLQEPPLSTSLQQAQPALYSGHVIVTPNHALAVVRDGEETLELSEIYRKKMHDKMKASECVDNKMKAEALKEQNTRPIKALTVYPPNTPATLVPRVLPTKSQELLGSYLVYLRHLKESVDTLREIVEEAKVERPLHRSLAFACRYTKHSHELLEYVFVTCPKVFNQQVKKHAHTPKKKQVTFEDQITTSSSNTHKHVEPMHTQKSNVPVPPSTGVNSCTDASGS